MKKKEVKVGKKVYFYDKNRDCIDEGTIKRFFDNGNVYVLNYPRTFCKPYYELYKTIREAIKEMDNWKNYQYIEQKSKIHSVEDLIRFMFDNETVETSDYSYDVNRKVAIDCARELLNIDLLKKEQEENNYVGK